MKLLNIDKLSQKTQKSVQINGVKYEIAPISVGVFIKKTKEAEEYVKSGQVDQMKELEMVLDLLSECIPAAPRHVLESLGLDEMQAIADFIQKDDVDGAEDVEGNA